MANLKISDKFRTNPLSLKPGGYEVTVVYQDGQRYIYDKVKNPGAYVRHIEEKGNNAHHGEVIEVLVDSATVWNKNSLGRNPWEIKM